MAVELIGGTQSPLQRGFLRAAVVRRLSEPSADVRFDVHDVDTLGLESGPDAVTFGAVVNGWHPVKFDEFLSPRRVERTMIGTSLVPMTIAGLGRETPGFLTALAKEFQRQVAWSQDVTAGTGLTQPDEVRERGEQLLSDGLACFQAHPTWSAGCSALGRCLIPELQDVALSTTSDYWSIEALAKHPDRFTVLDAFLTSDVLREASGNIIGRSGQHVPYFVLWKQGEYMVRESLLVNGMKLFLGKERLARLDDLRGSADLATLIAQRGFQQVTFAPKAIPLYAQLRQTGRLFGKEAAYAEQGERLIRCLNQPVHPTLIVRFDLAKAFGRPAWRSVVRFLRRNIMGSGSEFVIKFWQHEPTLIGLWLLGGDELVQKVIETATVHPRGGQFDPAAIRSRHVLPENRGTEFRGREPGSRPARDSEDHRPLGD